LDGSRGKVEFMQADLSNMKDLYRGFDLILVSNLLERSYNPAKFLETVHERLNEGGLLVIACTNAWSEQFTKKENWIGGYKDATGENVSTRDGLGALLKNFREFREPVNVPQAIRRSGRTWDYAISEVTFWVRDRTEH
ncbi:MAG: methyltransferase domain-containing protein, partial [Puniceicoccales bacterium]